jgi:uncharacterized DUF497 family protein
VRFEWDPRKSLTNQARHGIDFAAAQALWDDPRRIEVAARPMDEPRSLITGRIGQTLWSAVVTYRHAHTTIRLISVRRARKEEAARYEEEDRV